MGQRALAKRFTHKSDTLVHNKKEASDFEQWSQRQDPEGVSWRYDSGSKKFHPVPLASSKAVDNAVDKRVDKFVYTNVNSSVDSWDAKVDSFMGEVSRRD